MGLEGLGPEMLLRRVRSGVCASKPGRARRKWRASSPDGPWVGTSPEMLRRWRYEDEPARLGVDAQTGVERQVDRDRAEALVACA